MNSMNDVDAIETREWLDALDSVDAFEGVGRVDELLSDIVQAARRKGAKLSFAANSAYVNTIPPRQTLDPLVESAPVAGQIFDNAQHARRQDIWWRGQDARQLGAQEPLSRGPGFRSCFPPNIVLSSCRYLNQTLP